MRPPQRPSKRRPPPNREVVGRSKSGASQSKTRVSDKFSAYFTHHHRTALQSLMRLLSTPMQSAMTCLVVAIALALPTMLYVGLLNVQSLGGGWEGVPKISVFLHKRAQDRALEDLKQRLLAKPEVSAVDYISPNQALEEFQVGSGFGDVLASLEDNPLPGVLSIQPATTATPAQLHSLEKQLAGEAVVEDVRLDMEWVRRLHQLMALAQRLVLAFGVLLALGVLLVTGNTIRLAIESRRDEIIIVKLVGGTNAFIRRPFLYTGWWYGFGGGVLAWILLTVGLAGLSAPVAKLADLYQSDFRLQGLNFSASLVLLIGSGTLGLLGSWLAVSRHLGTIEPQ